jgi:hypothetical protein
MELSEDTKFAICVAAGVPIESDFDSATGTMTMRTVPRCDVIEPEPGRFIVAIAPEEPPERERRARYIFGN